MGVLYAGRDIGKEINAVYNMVETDYNGRMKMPETFSNWGFVCRRHLR